MKKVSQKSGKNQSSKDGPKIKTEMNGRGLTAYAGLLPVLNFMKMIGFKEKVNMEVPIARSSNAIYQFADVVQMIILGLIAGATAMEHIAAVCADDVLRRMAGWKDSPAATTFTRIMNAVKFSHIVGFESLIHRLRGRVWKYAIRSGHKLKSGLSVMWLDVDSTVEGVFGEQEGAEKGYNSKKKGQKSYHPLMAFVTETREVLHSWFRAGSAYTSNGIVEFMKECMAHINNGVRVIFRGDSGFFGGELLDYLESVGAGYLIKVKLKNLNSLLSRQSWTTATGNPGWEQTVFFHQCSTWSCSRRFVAVRRLVKIEKGLFDVPVYDYFCYVTTESLSPMSVHRKYGERATCETWIEECKSQMRAGTIRTSDFLTNAALFQCAVLAYNLLKWMSLLTGGEVRHWEVKTIRLYLVRLAGKLTGGGRQLILKLPKRFLRQAQWHKWEQMSLTVALQ